MSVEQPIKFIDRFSTDSLALGLRIACFAFYFSCIASGRRWIRHIKEHLRQFFPSRLRAKRVFQFLERLRLLRPSFERRTFLGIFYSAGCGDGRRACALLYGVLRRMCRTTCVSGMISPFGEYPKERQPSVFSAEL